MTVHGPSVAEPELSEAGRPEAPTQVADYGPTGSLESMDPENEVQLGFAIRPYEIADPSSRAGLLLSRVNAVATARRMNAVTTHAIENDARALLVADPPGANSVLGALAALHGRVGDVRAHFDAALELAEFCPIVHLNCSIALLQAGDSVHAYRMARKADEVARGAVALLPHLITCAFESGHFRETLERCERWHDAYPRTNLTPCGAAQGILDAIEQGALSERGAATALRTANQIRGAAGIRPTAGALYRNVRRPREFRYRIEVHTTRQKAQDLSAEVADRLAQSARAARKADNTLRIVFVASP